MIGLRVPMRVTFLVLVVVATMGAVLPNPSTADAAVDVFVVNSTADDTDGGGCQQAPTGDCTLREAVNAADADADFSTIDFAIPGLGTHAIPTTGVVLTTPALVDGTSQPGASCPGGPMIELADSGSRAHNGIGLANPTATSPADGITLKGFAITGFDI